MTRAALGRTAARGLAALLGLYVLFLCAMFMIMRQPPQRFGHIMRHFPMPAMLLVPFEPMWNVARGGALQVGDMAPDFTLPRTDHARDERLSAYRGQPVVLVFGSYT